MFLINFYWHIWTKIAQYRFCKKYADKIKKLPNYSFFLRHIWKKEYVKYAFVNTAIYDVADNADFNKLIRNIYRLRNNKKLRVETHYLYHRFRRVNYINSNLTGRQVGHIATIYLDNDKWIKTIKIAYTYANNSQAIIQYLFTFRKVMNTPLKIHQFIEDNIIQSKKESYFYAYGDMSAIDKIDYQELYRLDGILFDDIIQSYICKLFSTRYGKRYQLPIEYSCRIKNYNEKVKNRLRNAFLRTEYEKRNEHIIICSYDKRYEIYCLNTGKHYPSPKMLQYFSTFPTEMYYKVFSRIEVEELERRMRKYLNSNKSFVSSKDIKWLVNKKRYITEQEQRMKDTLNEDNRQYISRMTGWDCYIGGRKQNIDFLNYPGETNYFLKLYDENLAYLNAISNVQNSKVLVIITVATLIATIIGILIEII